MRTEHTYTATDEPFDMFEVDEALHRIEKLFKKCKGKKKKKLMKELAFIQNECCKCKSK